MSVAKATAATGERIEGLVGEAETHVLCHGHTTESLARALGVSPATAARVLARLRRKLAARGGELVSVRKGRAWHYEIREEDRLAELWRSDPLLKAVGALRGSARRPGRSIDDVVYDGR